MEKVEIVAKGDAVWLEYVTIGFRQERKRGHPVNRNSS